MVFESINLFNEEAETESTVIIIIIFAKELKKF